MFLAFGASAFTAAAQPATVTGAWVRAPVAGQKVAGAYMEITGRTNGWLIAVGSPVAARAELHATTFEDGVMKMRAVERLDLPGGKAVRLAPGGLHIMLIDLKQPLKRGDKVPISLTFLRDDLASRAIFSVQAEVRDAALPAGHQHH